MDHMVVTLKRTIWQSREYRTFGCYGRRVYVASVWKSVYNGLKYHVVARVKWVMWSSREAYQSKVMVRVFLTVGNTKVAFPSVHS